MITKKCSICGKEFNAKQRNYSLCSDECREINRNRKREKYIAKNYNNIVVQSKAYYDEHYKKHYNGKCIGCGKEVHGNTYYCLDCLIKGDASPDTKFRQYCKGLLNNRGVEPKIVKQSRREMIEKDGYTYIHNFDEATTGERLSQIIREQGYTIQETADLLFVNNKTLISYKYNTLPMPDYVAELIANKFNVNKEWLLTGKVG